jgi:transcriptional regulator with XRE-family HTH domain
LEEEQEPKRLGILLKRCRARIAPERAALGVVLRLPNRPGKRVTQEEVAEAVGISCQWYASLENDRALRVSTRVLGRIADVLMMDPTERAALFRLAVPQLRSVSLTDTSAAILDAFRSLRALTRRLWVATSEAEALTLVREFAMTELVPDAVLTCVRTAEGRWDQVGTGNHDDDERAKRSLALLKERFGARAVDDVLLYPLIAQPGDVWSRSERDARLPDLASNLRDIFDAVGWERLSFVTACVQTRAGFVGRIVVVHHAGHEYSEIERAQLSTLAEIASLALSGSI